MKKNTFLILCLLSLAGLCSQSAWATIGFTASPSSQTASGGGTFNVTLSLDVTQSSNPANVASYDVIFEALAMQNGINLSGLFTITGASAPPSQPNWQSVGPGFPDSLTSTGSDHSGFVQSADEGFGGNNSAAQSVNTPISNLQLATYTFSIANGVVPGTYSFQTTLLATSPSKFSDVADNTGGAPFPADSRATFSITVVPEPATWSFIVLGSLGGIGFKLLRIRRAAKD